MGSIWPWFGKYSASGGIPPYPALLNHTPTTCRKHLATAQAKAVSRGTVSIGANFQRNMEKTILKQFASFRLFLIKATPMIRTSTLLYQSITVQ